MRAKRDAMDAKPRGMNSDWMSLWFESNARDAKMWQAMRVKFATDCSYVARSSADECSSAEKELSALEKDFKAAVGSE